jgi:heavy metal sensor kinase
MSSGRPKVRSVSARLSLLFLGLTSIVLGLFAASLWVWVSTGAERSLKRELEVHSLGFQKLFLEEYAELLRGDPIDIAREMQNYLDVDASIADICHADGSLLFSSSGFSLKRADYRLIVGRIVAPSGKELTIRFGINGRPYFDTLRQLRLYFAIFIPASITIAWIVGLLFARRALAPVEEIRRHAERISRVNVVERVPEPGTTGEFLNLARTFNEMLDRLQRAIEDLQNFAADAAHELRTPLANLRAEVEIAIQHPQAPEEHERTLVSVLEEVGRMNQIVTDLFTLAKLDMRQYALKRERVRLAALLQEAKETWEAPAAERGVSIHVDGPDAEVVGDPNALRRILMNLVENAIKYNRHGGRVTLSIERSDGKARVRVADTGIGIPTESLPHLFRRFYRVDKARSRESGGAGLGLAICKSFVEAHGGRIDVTSAVGEGTTFMVEIPESPHGSVQGVNHQDPPR